VQQPWNLNNTTILVFVRHVQAADRDSDGNLTNVETTPAASPDDTALGVVHTSLAAADRLPAEHLVDKGYTDSHVLVDSERNYGITNHWPGCRRSELAGSGWCGLCQGRLRD